jgi:hypothetical protein
MASDTPAVRLTFNAIDGAGGGPLLVPTMDRDSSVR